MEKRHPSSCDSVLRKDTLLLERFKYLLSSKAISLLLITYLLFAFIIQPGMAMTTNSDAAVRSGMSIVVNCLSTLLPASLTLVRTDIVTSPTKRILLTLPRMMLATLMPQLMLFAAVTDFGRAWIIQHRVNAAAKACFDNRNRASRPKTTIDAFGLLEALPQSGPEFDHPLLRRALRRVSLAFRPLGSFCAAASPMYMTW